MSALFTYSNMLGHDTSQHKSHANMPNQVIFNAQTCTYTHTMYTLNSTVNIHTRASLTAYMYIYHTQANHPNS